LKFIPISVSFGPIFRTDRKIIPETVSFGPVFTSRNEKSVKKRSRNGKVLPVNHASHRFLTAKTENHTKNGQFWTGFLPRK
jgi:hypothetical protein